LPSFRTRAHRALSLSLHLHARAAALISSSRRHPLSLLFLRVRSSPNL
jgi:hypothetical protein